MNTNSQPTHIFKIHFSTVEQIQKFVEFVSKIHVSFDLSLGRYTVDAKSIMGIFSLDLSKDSDLIVNTDDGMLIDYLKTNLEALGIIKND